MSTYSDPLALFAATVNMLNKEDWAGVARLSDPASLAVFKRDLVASISPHGGDEQKVTALGLMKAMPTMPRAVAEYQAARFRESLEPKHRLREEVPSVRSREALEAMTPAGVFAAWLEGKSLRRQVDRNVEMKRMTRATANELVATAHRKFNLHTIGCVTDGDRIAHVIYRRDESFRGPFRDIGNPSLEGRSADEIALMRDAWGRDHLLTVMVRRQPDNGWMLVADRQFPIADEIEFDSTDEVDYDQ